MFLIPILGSSLVTTAIKSRNDMQWQTWQNFNQASLRAQISLFLGCEYMIQVNFPIKEKDPQGLQQLSKSWNRWAWSQGMRQQCRTQRGRVNQYLGMKTSLGQLLGAASSSQCLLLPCSLWPLTLILERLAILVTSTGRWSTMYLWIQILWLSTCLSSMGNSLNIKTQWGAIISGLLDIAHPLRCW